MWWWRRSSRATRRCRNPGPAPAPPGTRRWPRWIGCSSTRRARRYSTNWTPQLRGGLRVDWPAMTRFTKRAVADGILRSEVLRLARLVPDIAQADDAIAELLSSFSVYRTYLPLGAEYLAEAVDRASSTPPGDSAGAIRDDRRPAGRCRFGVLGALPADVRHGDGQGRRGLRVLPLDPAHLADRGRRRAGAVLAVARRSFTTCSAIGCDRSPNTMTALSTHDTKRSEDVRARISVISEMAADWAAAVREWNRLAPLGRRPAGQSAVAGGGRRLADRTATAARVRGEGGPRGRGVDDAGSTPTRAFEQRLHALVDAVYDDAELHSGIVAMADRLLPFGRSNSLVRQADPAHRTGRPGRLPGHRDVGSVAGRPGQPAAGRLLADGPNCSPRSTAARCPIWMPTTRARSNCW